MLKFQQSLHKFFNRDINIVSEKKEHFFKQFSGKLFIYFYVILITFSLIGVVINIKDREDQKPIYSRDQAIRKNVSWMSEYPFFLLLIPGIYIFAMKKAKKNTKKKFK